ncbi:MAG: sulfotransferase [Comamonadaceae bacterium]|nr:sulfotransferase [Comamonadaceae bacterium]
MFSGYLVGLFRRAWGKGLACYARRGLSAGAALRPAQPRARAMEMFRTQDLPQLAGLVCAIALLNVLRLTSGSVVLPAAVLAGFIFVERSNKILRLVRAPGDADLLGLLAPGLEPLRSPVLWAILAAAVVAGFIVPMAAGRSGIRRASGHPRKLSPHLPLCHVQPGAPIDVWLARLFQARFRIPMVYLPRLAVVLSVSCLNTVLCLPERLLLPLVLRRCGVPDPVFILGAHRSGTTHLHNLMALDPGLIPARTYEVFNPDGYMVCGWPLALALAAFMPWKRPQDPMDLGIRSPQEDEFAMLNSTGLSPYWAMSFPQHCGQYLETAYPDRLAPRT